MILSQRISYHDVDDVEAFCRQILNDHIAHGARRANGTLTGPRPFSAEDYESCLSDLIGDAWLAAQRFDGRGRFSGYLAWKLHKQITEWKRRNWKRTRYLTTPITETPYDDELNGAVHHDDDLIGINPERLSARGRHAYRKVCLPLAESGLEPSEFARRTKQSELWVHQALRIVRVELEAQDIRPSTRPEVPKVEACRGESTPSSCSSGAEPLANTA